MYTKYPVARTSKTRYVVAMKLAISLAAVSVLTLSCGQSKRTTMLEARVDQLDKSMQELRDHVAAQERMNEQLLTALAANLGHGDGGGDGGKGGAPAEPDPTVMYAVPLQDSPAVGPAHAKITMVVAIDYACPYCHRAEATIASLRKRYGNSLRVVTKNLIVHPPAKIAALAACAAQHQGKWEAMSDALWTAVFGTGDRADYDQFTDDKMLAIADKLGLKKAQFKTDLNGAECAGQIDRDGALLNSFGARGTPAFFINGRYVAGAMPEDDFVKLIDAELKEVDAAVAAGTKAEDYYDSVVMKGVTPNAAD